VDCSTYITRFYRSPSQVLGLAASTQDPDAIRRRFLALFESKRASPSAQQELQMLCSAFVLLMGRIQPQQTQVTNNFAVQSAQITLLNTADARCAALREHASELEVRLGQAQQENMRLQQAMQAAGRQVQALQGAMHELQAQLDLARHSAPYADAVISFLRCRCVQGDDSLFVGSAELHAALLAFLAEQQQQQQDEGKAQPPSQRELRALLEHLGFQYRQTWTRGANVRGFRRLALRASWQESSAAARLQQ
jgi:chromosome segregation ATPase